MKKKNKQETIIGERIKKVFETKNMSITQFAELLHYDPSNIHNIFRRKKIETFLLLDISEILHHDFIEEIRAENGYSSGISSSNISLILEINTIDPKTLNKLIKIIKQLEIKAIDTSKD